ncbi:dihydropteroate synthase [Rhodopirellula islandica]|uniref:Dihydropteroate synthase n=1 Tax=Rhodopirellula islandica TaxID=595434 RepID=A0A0J1B503_RHOIS|nr:dihydropteroate synthase [Rhodopirellula islandica]KLU01561.1 dihydropteroate synthase [Rhodopirellula islandica]
MLTSPPTLTADSHVHFLTGRLAETAVSEEATRIANKFGCRHSVGVVPITVAALITPKWLSRHWEIPESATHVILPGFLQDNLEAAGDLAAPLLGLIQQTSAEVICGPKDCRDLHAWMTGRQESVDLSAHSIEIIAEINHAPRLPVAEVVQLANRLQADGADRIDVGCDPSRRCQAIGDYVSALIDAGHTISIDTFDPREAGDAIRAGATLVLSVSSANRDAARDWGCEVVAIPDVPDDLKSLDQTIEFLIRHSIPFRVDPILEPIGSAFTQSLLRYTEVRRRYPEVEMLMGIGNLTELTDVDSAGVNFLLLGICQELSIGSVLTTQVINWARSSVRECDIARRLVHHAVSRGVPPKRLSEELVMLRDPKLRPHSETALQALADGVKDNNYRLIAQDDSLHMISAGLHLTGKDPFELFAELMNRPQADNVDAAHAFYLGYEMAKATIALTLGKQYEQDQALHWGHLTVPEDTHRIERTSRHAPQPPKKDDTANG